MAGHRRGLRGTALPVVRSYGLPPRGGRQLASIHRVLRGNRQGKSPIDGWRLIIQPQFKQSIEDSGFWLTCLLCVVIVSQCKSPTCCGKHPRVTVEQMQLDMRVGSYQIAAPGPEVLQPQTNNCDKPQYDLSINLTAQLLLQGTPAFFRTPIGRPLLIRAPGRSPAEGRN
jgi:hypothetical protein